MGNQNQIEKLIAELCPNGVEFKELENICLSISAGGDLPEDYSKGQTSPSDEYPYPIYSNGANEKALYGYTNSFRIDSEAITISARGTIGYHTIRKKKFTPIIRLITIIPNTEIILIGFLNYVLDITEIGSSGGSIPQLTVPNVKKFQIPIPPLPIQQEIVKILDSFTDLEAELEAELEARKKQYEWYKDNLLKIDNKTELFPLSAVCKPTQNISWRNNTNKYKYIDLSSVSRDDHSIKETVTITSENAPSRAQKLVQEKDILFATTRPTLKRYTYIYKEYDGQIASTGYCVLRADIEKVLPKWILYCISTTKFNTYVESNQEGSAYPSISEIKVKAFQIPVPSLTEQERIVSMLDKFDALVNDISIGLPAELNARRQQYEYYRNKLLTFKELEK